jgi:hypothetical protein
MNPGLEFVITFASEPMLYVIKRQFREDAQSAIQQAFYYVLFGNIYQAPSLRACLQARMDRCVHFLGTAFSQLKRDLEPLAWREKERNKRLKSAHAAHITGLAQVHGSSGAESGVAPEEEHDAIQGGAASGRLAVSTPSSEGQAAPSILYDCESVDGALEAAAARRDEGGTSAAVAASGRGGGTGRGGGCAVQDVREQGAEREQRTAQAIVQQEALTAARWHWVKQSDTVILNVLSRWAP